MRQKNVFKQCDCVFDDYGRKAKWRRHEHSDLNFQSCPMHATLQVMTLDLYISWHLGHFAYWFLIINVTCRSYNYRKATVATNFPWDLTTKILLRAFGAKKPNTFPIHSCMLRIGDFVEISNCEHDIVGSWSIKTLLPRDAVLFAFSCVKYVVVFMYFYTFLFTPGLSKCIATCHAKSGVSSGENYCSFILNVKIYIYSRLPI